ncbi:MAG: hypothetical protein M3186_11435 [Actinomycetota bacterium]|nr:hypothetical protein [Actinomycetota bacterium]
MIVAVHTDAAGLGDQVQAAAVPATYQVQINGTWRDALLVGEVASRLFGDDSEDMCQRCALLCRREPKPGCIAARRLSAVAVDHGTQGLNEEVRVVAVDVVAGVIPPLS